MGGEVEVFFVYLGFLFVCGVVWLVGLVLVLVNIAQKSGGRGPALFPCMVPVCFWLTERGEFLTESLERNPEGSSNATFK